LAQLQQDGEARIVYVYRDIRDVVASISMKYSIPAFSFIGGGVQSILREFEQWTSIPGIHVARYEQMLDDLPGEIVRLSAYLGIPVDETGAAKLAAEFSLDRQRARISSAFSGKGGTTGRGRNEHDPLSLLHNHHIQSGAHGSYRGVLRTREIAALEWVCRHWLRAHGYRPDNTRALQLASFGWYALRAEVNALRRRVSGSGA
jgi:hypothetical protein